MDTAGIRQSSEVVEALGIQRSLAAMETAQLVLFVCEACNPPAEEDREILSKTEGKDRLILLNKCDRGVNGEAMAFFEKYDPILISAKTGEGIDKVEQAIVDFASQGSGETTQCALIVNERHKALIDSAAQSISRAVDALEGGLPGDLIEIDINECRNRLGLITGETADEDLINDIFSKFCLGK